MSKVQEDAVGENARKIVEAEKKVSEASRAQYNSRMKGKPTPTQEENDLAACGAHILEHEADGSDPDPVNAAFQDKTVEAGKPAQNYQTRHQTASHSSKHE
jgi:hypothetical protein